MDRHASTIKRHRQSLKRNERNRAAKSRVKTSVKQVDSASTKEAAEVALREAITLIDKSAQAHILHKNRAARLKSKLTQKVASRFTS